MLQEINKEWSLFLDRDGVINERKPGSYVMRWNEFRFLNGVKEAVRILSNNFGKIVVVTNQRGVARGLVNPAELELIHQNMLHEIEKNGGRIDKIYTCPDMESENRKPNPGMGLQALKDFPEIDLKKSVMIGDAMSDMDFGRNLGVALNILLKPTRKMVYLAQPSVDLVYDDLLSIAEDLPVR